MKLDNEENFKILHLKNKENLINATLLPRKRSMSNSILKILGITTKELEETSPIEELPNRLSVSSLNE